MQLYLANDNILYLLEVKNELTDAYLNSATVTAQLKTKAGVNVGSPLTLTPLGSAVAVTVDGRTYPDGNYRVVVEEDTPFVAGIDYDYHIDVDAGSDLKAHWETPTRAVKRT